MAARRKAKPVPAPRWAVALFLVLCALTALTGLVQLWLGHEGKSLVILSLILMSRVACPGPFLDVSDLKKLMK
jgi:hypothetical protein